MKQHNMAVNIKCFTVPKSHALVHVHFHFIMNVTKDSNPCCVPQQAKQPKIRLLQKKIT